MCVHVFVQANNKSALYVHKKKMKFISYMFLLTYRTANIRH
jgi:hypothetical protein